MILHGTDQLLKQFGLLAILFLSFSLQAQKVSEEPEFIIKTFPSEKGWGYDIYADGKRYVHQPHIPAVSGVVSFPTEAQARKTAKLAIIKIKEGIIPPTVSIEELDSLGVNYSPSD